MILANYQICAITYAGHEFLETIRLKTVWDKTKKVVSQVGSSTLKFVESTAQMMLTECAKQAVTSAMAAGQLI